MQRPEATRVRAEEAIEAGNLALLSPRYHGRILDNSLAGTNLGHYRIVAAIGSGGMGDVYRAVDTRLGREVALKVLPPAMASDPERLERFKREARALAALDHPGVVGVYSVEEAGSVHYLTMQLVAGQTLERLIPPGGMPFAQIVDIASTLADTLAAAHEKGIVHRDLKPANLMLTGDGRLKVLDFGLARITARDEQLGTDPDLATDMKTRDGIVMGTVPYMSPEQLRGEAVDARSDLFSFGVILYEMATGQRPFHGQSAPELASAILRDAPKPAGQLRAGLPAALERVIDRCLAKEASERFTSARDLHDAIRAIDAETGRSPSAGNDALTTVIEPQRARGRRLTRRHLVIAAILVVVIAVPVVWLLRRSAPPAAASNLTLAVLPIENLGGDSGTEYLADGMTSELSGALKKIPGLRVAGDLSTFRFKGKHVEPAEIARELGVEMLVTGKLQPAPGRVRLQMQMSNADGTLLWSNTFDGASKDTFAMQDDITGAIASELRLVLSPKTLAVARAGRTENAEAHDLFMHGQFEKNKLNPQGLANALVYFTRALELDPNYAQAHAGVAFVYDIQADVYAPSHEYHTLALGAARRAVESDPLLAEGHVLLGYELAAALWDFDGGRAEMQKGLALDPNSPDGLFMFALFSGLSGDNSRGLALADRLVRVDPLSPLAAHVRAEVLLWGERYEEALAQHRLAAKLDPSVVLFDSVAGDALRELGRLDESVAAFQDEQKYFEQPFFGLALTYHRMGRQEDALRVVRALEEREKRQWVDPDVIAIAYAGIGDRDHAMEWLEKGYEKKTFGVKLFLSWNCLWFRSMNDDPRFIELRKRVMSTTLRS